MKLPRTESLILFAFLGCVALWGISKCSEQRTDTVRRVRDLAADDDQEERPARPDTVVAPKPQATQQTPVVQQPQPAAAPPPQPTQYTTTTPKPGAAPTKPTLQNPAPVTAKPAEPAAAKTGSVLYVAIDGLKVRKEPGLKGETVEQLKLYDQVTFLNQKTEWKQEINLGKETVNDHWVKIRTAAGKTGWVFGAGVHYYKMKREGVVEETKTAPAKKKQ